MNKTSMTALVSAFARAWHAEHKAVTVFNDSVARSLFSDQEYAQIAQQMSAGIQFFCPGFCGTAEEALGWIVDHQLSPSPLGRSVWTEQALRTAVSLGTRQYLLLAAGYDTFAYRQPEWAQQLQIFELDQPAMLQDKQSRLQRAGLTPPDNTHYLPADLSQPQWIQQLLDQPQFKPQQRSFCSLLGLVYYLPAAAFSTLLEGLSSILPSGSTLAFDYPQQQDTAAAQTQKQEQLAQAAGETMQAAYSEQELAQRLEQQGFLIYEHLQPREITQQYFTACNRADPAHPLQAFAQVNYCLAVKR